MVNKRRVNLVSEMVPFKLLISREEAIKRIMSSRETC